MHPLMRIGHSRYLDGIFVVCEWNFHRMGTESSWYGNGTSVVREWDICGWNLCYMGMEFSLDGNLIFVVWECNLDVMGYPW